MICSPDPPCPPRLLARLSIDATLLAGHAAEAGPCGGRPFERAAGALLRRPELSCRQAAGLTTLWSIGSASGAAHEVDAAARGHAQAFLIEAKSGAVGKADLAVFQRKVEDFYLARWRRVVGHAWWLMFVSVQDPGDALRRLAAHLGVVLCDGVRLPLPALWHFAGDPVWAGDLPPRLVVDLLRLAPQTVLALQHRLVPDLNTGRLLLDPDRLSAAAVKHLLYLQDELTDAVLDRFDRLWPGRLERRGAQLASQLDQAVRVL